MSLFSEKALDFRTSLHTTSTYQLSFVGVHGAAMLLSRHRSPYNTRSRRNRNCHLVLISSVSSLKLRSMLDRLSYTFITIYRADATSEDDHFDWLTTKRAPLTSEAIHAGLSECSNNEKHREELGSGRTSAQLFFFFLYCILPAEFAAHARCRLQNAAEVVVHLMSLVNSYSSSDVNCG